MVHYSTVFFDLYGTLVDIVTDEDGERTWQKFHTYLEAHGANALSAHQLRAVYQQGRARLLAHCAQQAERRQAAVAVQDKRLADRWWPDPDYAPVFREMLVKAGAREPVGQEQIAQAGAAFRRASVRRFRLFPGVLSLLADLRSLGIHLVLLSNAQHLYTVPELDQLGLAPFFDRIFISSDFGWRKPTPAYFRFALRTSKADPSRTLMVGNDAQSDILGAHLAGLDSAYLFTGSWPGNDRFPLPQATYNIRGADYRKLRNIVEGLSTS